MFKQRDIQKSQKPTCSNLGIWKGRLEWPQCRHSHTRSCSDTPSSGSEVALKRNSSHTNNGFYVYLIIYLFIKGHKNIDLNWVNTTSMRVNTRYRKFISAITGWYVHIFNFERWRGHPLKNKEKRGGRGSCLDSQWVYHRGIETVYRRIIQSRELNSARKTTNLHKIHSVVEFVYLYLLVCQVRVTVGDSVLCYRGCLTSFGRYLISLFDDSAQALLNFLVWWFGTGAT